MTFSTQALAAELAADPAGLGYDGSSAIEAAELITARTQKAPIEAGAVMRYLMVAGKDARIAALAAGLIEGTEAQKLAAVAIMRALAVIPSYDLSVSAYAAAINRDLDALVAAELIDAPHKAAILALGDNKRSRCEELGWPTVAADDIARARAS